MGYGGRELEAGGYGVYKGPKIGARLWGVGGGGYKYRCPHVQIRFSLYYQSHLTEKYGTTGLGDL